MRNRVALQDLTMLAAALAVTAYVLLQVDVFAKPGVRPKGSVIEADEVPVLGIVLSVGLLLFAWRRMCAYKREVTARREMQTQLHNLAFRDPLTGLANRRELLEQLSVAVASPPGSGAVHAIFMLDLNGFKRINDVYGHAAGDQTLMIVAQRILGAARDGDLVARLGGDEFAIVATQMPSSESATGLALRVIAALEKPIVAGQVEHRISAGVGFCLLPYPSASADETLRRADVALYKAKKEGQSALRCFDDDLDRQVRERDYLERQLRHALGAGDIQPHFQPLVDLGTERIVAFECLARWSHSTLGDVPPERFIAVAEDMGLIRSLTDHLLTTACRVASAWPAHIGLSINLSPIDLKDSSRGDQILDIVRHSGLSPRRLEVEITESALVRDMEAARTVLEALRTAGVSIALDDFGTGYSSLYHLRNFKIDKIKIDRSFVRDLSDGREKPEIAAALIGLGAGLGLTVTAEGIEKPSDERRLRTLGCQQGQGFLFSKAVPAEETLTLLRAPSSGARIVVA